MSEATSPQWVEIKRGLLVRVGVPVSILEGFREGLDELVYCKKSKRVFVKKGEVDEVERERLRAELEHLRADFRELKDA